MTDERSKVEFLAVRVMEYTPRAGYAIGAFQWTNANGLRCTRFNWNPFHSIEDARELLDNVPEEKREAVMVAIIGPPVIKPEDCWSLLTASPEAISEAVLKVYDYYAG
jgi:hypothetical protein